MQSGVFEIFLCCETNAGAECYGVDKELLRELRSVHADTRGGGYDGTDN
jgi:hypothetical protein